MSDTVMLVVGLVGWAMAGGLVWVLGVRTDRRTDLEVAGVAADVDEVERKLLERVRTMEVHIAGGADQFDKYDGVLRELNLRVARAEATIAATPTPPDPATIIAAATAPLLALTEQYTSPHQILAPSAPQPTAADGEWSAEDLAAYDPTDEDFPPYRAADDYSPPASFSGLGVELPRLDG